MRNATLKDLVSLLTEQQGRKVDVIAPATKFHFQNGLLAVSGVEPVLSDDGVTAVDGLFLPTRTFDEGLASKLNIPLKYVRRMREERTDLYDANANGWLRGWGDRYNKVASPDRRNFLLRLFKGEGDEPGVARAMLSDRYKMIENLDVLTAALDGVKEAGVEIEFAGCDLTENRMYVRVLAPQVKAYAHSLLSGYRSPWTGATGDENPTVFAGFEISNSETGGGAFVITPRLVIEVCSNGLKITKDVMRGVHIGAQQDAGVVRWSDQTQKMQVDLIRSQTKDAVTTFLDVEYVQSTLGEIEADALTPLTAGPQRVIEQVGRSLAYDNDTIEAVLGHFVTGGQLTAGGVMNAVTAHAQEIEDADAAAELESTALAAMVTAAQFSPSLRT